ncbi:MAG TPA: hypothetical protein VE973_00650, partial [Candidatus Limnocylindria bacterium]|nr:hypothetical protein [Candidatus Limnocylindria bacterium]
MEAPKSKYNLTFWQLFLVIVLALVLGGFIFYFAYGNILQDELYSISFTRHNAATTTPSKIPAKT